MIDLTQGPLHRRGDEQLLIEPRLLEPLQHAAKVIDALLVRDQTFREREQPGGMVFDALAGRWQPEELDALRARDAAELRRAVTFRDEERVAHLDGVVGKE